MTSPYVKKILGFTTKPFLLAFKNLILYSSDITKNMWAIFLNIRTYGLMLFIPRRHPYYTKYFYTSFTRRFGTEIETWCKL